MSHHEKRPRLFSRVFDDIIRSPLLSSNDLRLYMIMLSYCRKVKPEEPKVCKLTQNYMAGIMRVSLRTVFSCISNLKGAGLIKVDFQGGLKNLPVYTLVDNPPVLCPEDLTSNKAVDAKAHVKKSGGVKALQRRGKKHDQIVKHTGRPKSWEGFTLESEDTASVDPGSIDVEPSNNANLSSTENTSVCGTNPDDDSPSQEPEKGQGDTQPVAYPYATSCVSLRNQLPVDTQPVAYPYATGCCPVHIHLNEHLEERPNGLRSESESALAPHLRAAGGGDEVSICTTEDKTELNYLENQDLTNSGPKTNELCRVLRISDIENEETDVMAKETKEQEEARKALQAAKRKGTYTAGIKTSSANPRREEEELVLGLQTAPNEASGGEVGLVHRVIENHLTEDPEKVSEVPPSPVGLYMHFCKVVRRKYPDARLADVADSRKYIKWAKELLGKNSRADLYEMIRILVLDYENIGLSKKFIKFYNSTATPVFDQLYCNTDFLKTYIGRGITAPPSVRFSAYLEDYKRRHAQPTTSADISGMQDSAAPTLSESGKKAIDPLEAIRDQVNG